ncbi:MAG: glycosyltransferase [Eubacteriales bacterium]|nr:glycosyltransferase [Eubacteriales bacterium]MDD3082069.1 glycosyltransferase [Desulfobacterales bacterium]MDD3951529.1 glycosyltransferase [Desulfobacterales bacterium]
MKSSTVSVVMATYNHADFVAQSIESVLNQKDVDFEFLIADDGSVDHTRDVVAAIPDERIRFFPYRENRGACTVTNELIQRASGEFVAIINSDDYWIGSDKLARQLQVMRENPAIGACFGRVRFVDRAGVSIDKSQMPRGGVFDQENRSRGAWLRHFFDQGNCICHPTMLIRRACYDVLGLYDNRLRQLPDFDMWVRLVKRYDIHVSNREMIAFRQLPGENASSATCVNLRRLMNEFYFVLQKFFDEIPRDVFLDGFGNLLTAPDPPDKAHIDIEQALLYLGKNRWASHIYNLIGLERMHFLLGSEPHRRILIDRYGIDDRAFHSLSAETGVFDLEDPAAKLSVIDGISLVAEVKRRVLLRIPTVFRPILNCILKRF